MGLEIVELVIAWEQAFGISIPNGTAAQLTTPEIAASEISRILHAHGRNIGMPEIHRIIKATTLEISGLPDGKYAVNLRFAQDFGMD